MRILAHLFLPHHSNNFRARVLHPSAIFAVAIFLLLSSFSHAPARIAKVLGLTASRLPIERLVELTNQKRIQAGFAPLAVDENLISAARLKGSDMLSRDYWAHIAPDGTTPWAFFTHAGYSYHFAGENLARDFDNPESVVETWMASPTHKENMLSGKYKDIGIAVVEGELDGKPTTLVVQLFGSRTSGAPASTVGQLTTQETSEEAASSTAPPILANFGIASAASPFVVQKNIAQMLVFLFGLVLALDGLIIWQRRITRIGGRTLAHFCFLLTIGMILFVIQKGSIL